MPVASHTYRPLGAALTAVSGRKQSKLRGAARERGGGGGEICILRKELTLIITFTALIKGEQAEGLGANGIANFSGRT